MLLKGKNKIIARVFFMTMVLGLSYACENPKEKTLSETEQRAQDSLSKIEQRQKADSLRKTNPLLIVPPDSQYTGEYIDKYESGIIKFKGFFRFGQRHGHWRAFYPTGVLWSEMHYDKGVNDGPNITYYENGKIRYTGFYKKDLKDSVWTYYDTTGTVLEKVLYRENKAIQKLPK